MTLLRNLISAISGGESRGPKVDEILVTAKSNYAASPSTGDSLPSFGIRWGQLREELRATISTFGSSAEAIKFAQMRAIFDHREPVTTKDIPKIEIAQHFLKYEYPVYADKISLFRETRVTTPGTALEVPFSGGGTYFTSNILYFHAFHTLTGLRFKGDIDSVCEVGGGYGNPALTWLTNPVKPVARYCIVDMPEVLFFAEVFLRTALPDLKVHYVTEQQPPSTSPGVTLVPIQLASQTRKVPFDLLVNTGSLAEMTDDWVNYWGDWIDQQNTKLFYSHNYMGNPAHEVYEAPTTLAPIVRPDWRPVYVRPMHPMMYLQSAGRWASEIIFERTADDGQDVADALKFFKGTRLRLENYVYILYALVRDLEKNGKYIGEFVRKVVHDFGFAPVELLYLLNKGSQDNPDLIALRDELQREVDSKYAEAQPHIKAAILGQQGFERART